MKLFYLETTAQSQGDLVDIRDGQRRVSGYFIDNTNDGKFLRYTTPVGTPQEYLTESEILATDYLPCVPNVPVFSARARAVLLEEIPSEVEFHEIFIFVNGKNLVYFLCKTRRRHHMLDDTRSEYTTTRNGDRIKSRQGYNSSLDEDFYIARDIEMPFFLAVSQKFVELCARRQLAIDFLEIKQAW